MIYNSKDLYENLKTCMTKFLLYANTVDNNTTIKIYENINYMHILLILCYIYIMSLPLLLILELHDFY